MDQLPAEILHLLCSFLKPTEAARFRLINKQCASIGIEYLLPSLWLGCLPESFARLEALSKRADLRLHLRELCFVAYELGDGKEDLEDYISRIYDLIAGGLTVHSQDSEYGNDYELLQELETQGKSSRLWKRHQHAKGYFKVLLRSDVEALFSRIVAKLPRLNRIVVTHDRPDNAYPAAHPFEKYYTRLSEVSSSHQIYIPILRALISNGNALKSVRLSVDFKQLCRMKKEDFEVLKTALSTLEEFDFPIDGVHDANDDYADEGEADDFERETDECYRQVLHSCKKIRTLCVGAPFQHLEAIVFDFVDYHYPHLKQLQLSNLCIWAPSFHTFLERHANTLEKVEMDSITYLYSEDQANCPDHIVDLIRAIRLAISPTKVVYTGSLYCSPLFESGDRWALNEACINVDGTGDVGHIFSALATDKWSIEGAASDEYRKILSANDYDQLWRQIFSAVVLESTVYLTCVRSYTSDGRVVLDYDELVKHEGVSIALLCYPPLPSWRCFI
ncbi:MAG: hypothetical protein MMC23_003821 [Stictis urceolatum]|nr:hypothetical protein [Stictis urceolata]